MNEQQIEQDLIAKLGNLKYTCRADVRDRAALEANFREKFEVLNRVQLTASEFQRLLCSLSPRCLMRKSIFRRCMQSWFRWTTKPGLPPRGTMSSSRSWDYRYCHDAICTPSRSSACLGESVGVESPDASNRGVVATRTARKTYTAPT